MTYAAVEVVWRANERAGVLSQDHQVVGQWVADVAWVKQTHTAQRDPAQRVAWEARQKYMYNKSLNA